MKEKTPCETHLSNEKNPGCLVYIGGYTTQLCRDYNKPLKGSLGLLTNQYTVMESRRFFFVAHLFSAIHTVGGRNPKQPHGMYKTCRKSWDTLPTSTG